MLGAIGARSKADEKPPETPRQAPLMELYARLQSAAEVMIDGDFSAEAQRTIDELKGERNEAVQSNELARHELSGLSERMVECAKKLGWIEPPLSEGAGNPIHMSMMFLGNMADQLRKLGEECPSEDRREAMSHRIERAARLGMKADPGAVAAIRGQLAMVYAEVEDLAGDTLVEKVKSAGSALTEARNREDLMAESVQCYRAQESAIKSRLSIALGDPREDSSVGSAVATITSLRHLLGISDAPGQFAEFERRMEILKASYPTFKQMFYDLDPAAEAVKPPSSDELA